MLGAGEQGRMGGELGVSRRKVVLIEWINSEAPQHSIGSHSQYPVINHEEKEYLKEESVYLSH